MEPKPARDSDHQHWEAAYDALRPLGDDPTAKTLTDEVLAHWAQLLAGLGRTEELGQLLAENADRVLDRGPLTQRWLRAREGYGYLVHRPDESYRCGANLVARVASLHYGRQADYSALLDEPSPRSWTMIRADA